MGRSRAPKRLDEVLDAALRVFEQKGFQRTRMADVARAAGVSPGLLYTYVISKEALFHIVLLRELGGVIDDRVLPVPNPDAAATERLARHALEEIATIPALEVALGVTAPTDVASEAAVIVGEHYDRVQRHRRFIRIAEQSAQDDPEIAEQTYTEQRRAYVLNLGRYISSRVVSGHFRPVPDPDVAARFVVETVAWFAMHRYNDFDGGQIDDAVARQTVVHLTTAALLPVPDVTGGSTG